MNAHELLLIAALSRRLGRVALVYIASLYRMNCFGTGRVFYAPRPSRPSGSARGSILLRAAGWAFALFILWAGAFVSPAEAVSPGDVVNNLATLDYTVPSDGSSGSVSDSASLTVVAPVTTATLNLFTYAPADPLATLWSITAGRYLDSGGVFQPVPTPPYPAGSSTPINLSAPVPLTSAPVHHMGDPLFIVIDDLDQNLDPSVINSVTVTVTDSLSGDTEVLLLYETGPDTGIFTGFVNTADSASISPVSFDSRLSLLPGSTITLSYDDNGTPVSVSALADPPGRVFDSRTGAVLDGFTVTVIDSSTGLPALVNGDDGISSFPNPVVTGGTYSDTSGKAYTFAPGQYRFPFLAPGDYMLVVNVPAGYTFPSLVSDAALQGLPGAPFVLSPVSRGTAFTVTDLNAIQVDLPVDTAAGSLFVTKTASRDSAAIGDHLQYRVTVEEGSGNTVFGATVTDRLPLGMVYVNGSAMINGSSAPDPAISQDRRTMAFSLGDMAPGESVEIKYVLAVASGTRPGDAVNSAYASGQFGEMSNVAEAVVRIYEDLFKGHATIMGRVVADACGRDPEATGEGVKGVRIYMEDGSYAVTDEKGLFHFEGVRPGGHVVQLDYDSLEPQYEPVLCTDTTEVSGTAFSRFVDIQGGTLWRSDFHLELKPRSRGEIKAAFNSSLATGESVEFSVPLHVENVDTKNVRITIMLPEQMRYSAGSSLLKGKTIADPEEMEGSLTYRLGNIAAPADIELRFMAMTTREGKEGKFTSRMLVTFDTAVDNNIRMPVLENILVRDLDEKFSTKAFVLSTEFEPLRSELSQKEMKALDKLASEIKPLGVEHIFAIGYTDSLPLSANALKLYASNYELSRQRARTVAYYIGEKLGLNDGNISFVGHGPDDPIGDNSTPEGRKKNRRVEIKAFYKKVERNFQLATEAGDAGKASMKITGLRGAQASVNTAAIIDAPEERMPVFDELWMRGAGEGLRMAWPGDNVHPSLPSLSAAILHRPGSTLELTLNGATVNPVYLEYTRIDRSQRKAVTVFKGIPLNDGDNLLRVRQLSDGTETGSFARNIHYATRPVKAEVVPEKSVLTADGRTTPVVAVRLTDKDGYPVRRGIQGEFSVSAPYKALEAEEGTADFMLEGRQRYKVGGDGTAYIQLAPTSQTGEALLTIHTADEGLDVRPWLLPVMRDWILVGYAEGTLGYNTLEGNAEALLENGHEDGAYTDGKVSFFAKGRVKGKWLLTMAYDSEKPSYNERELHSIIDPDAYYTLYGDSAQQGQEASSARKIYLKIESGKFYALFGDYDTGLTVTRLSRYSRSMNGFKADYNGERLRYRVFASDTSQAFVKDEIRGDGTSGLYRLSRKNIVLNSDKVSIEVRDRFSPDRVIETRRLTRHIDYDIDYMEGTLFFREPVNSTDRDFNPSFIVVDFESFDDSDTSYNYGGRGAVSLAEGRVEVGATFVHEDSVGKEGDLAGYDATVRLGNNTEVRAEFAATTVDTPAAGTKGSAYLFEVSRRHKALNAKAYVMENDADFGLGQQSVSERGLRRFGFDFTYEASRSMNVSGRAYKQDNLTTEAQRELAEAGIGYRHGSFVYTGGLRTVTDTFTDGTALVSDQITAGIEWHALNRRLKMKLLREQSISDSNDNADYPTRTSLGAEYRLSTSSTVFISQEYAESDEIDNQLTRAGITTVPWEGASIKSSLERQFNESGTRLFSNLGLTQSWKLSDEWAIGATLESRDTLSVSPVPSVDNSISASGEDFTAASLGSTYSRKGFSWRNRIELRAADSYDKSGLFMAINGEPRDGLGLSAALRALRTDWANGALKRDLSLRFGMVRRPVESRWTVLDRLDYISNQEKGVLFEYDTWRVVNNLNLNYKLEEKYQVSLQYGSKYVKDSIDGLDYKGYTDLKGLEVRYNLNSKWDVGARLSMLQSWEYDRNEYQSGLSAGYTYARNVWLSAGYNFDGFRDRDFSAADYTAAGPFFRFKVKFDQLSAMDAVRYFTGN